MAILLFLKLLGSLALLAFGLKVMVGGLQRYPRSLWRHYPARVADSRAGGLLMGTVAAGGLLSPVVSVLMAAAWADAGLLSLGRAVPVVLGATFGAGLAAWGLSQADGGMGGFDGMVLLILLSALALSAVRKDGCRSAGRCLLGLSLVLLGWGLLQGSVPGTVGEAARGYVTSYCVGHGASLSERPALLLVLAGALFTLCVQSPVAVLAGAMMLCPDGQGDSHASFALTLGSQLGAAVTPTLVTAVSGGYRARRVAVVYLLSVVFGVVCAGVLLGPWCDRLGAHVVPVTLCASGAASALLVWAARWPERVACHLVSPRGGEEERVLPHIEGGLPATAGEALRRAALEVGLFTRRVHVLFGMVRDLQNTTGGGDFARQTGRAEDYAATLQRMEAHIAGYLDLTWESWPMAERRAEAVRLRREVACLGGMLGCCHRLLGVTDYNFHSRASFTARQREHIGQMFQFVNEAMLQMPALRDGTVDADAGQMAADIEREINSFRDQLRMQNALDIANREYTSAVGIIYMDIIMECERLADYVACVTSPLPLPEEQRK